MYIGDRNILSKNSTFSTENSVGNILLFGNVSENNEVVTVSFAALNKSIYNKQTHKEGSARMAISHFKGKA